MRTAEAATGLENEVASQVRSLHQSLQALQLQELYGGHLAASQRTAIVIQKVAQEGAPTCVCRLCENLVLVESLQAHTQQCKVFTQCKTLASCSDANLSRVLAKLNATATAAHVFGPSGTQASTLLELLRSFCSVLLSLTAASHILPQLAGLLHKLDQLLTASNTNKHPAMEACWADVKAAGQRSSSSECDDVGIGAAADGGTSRAPTRSRAARRRASRTSSLCASCSGARTRRW